MAGGFEGADVDSAQWAALTAPLVPTSEAGALELGALYLSELRRITRRLVQPEIRDGRARLVLIRIVTLIEFGAAEARIQADEVECRLPIVRGVLVGGAGGALRIVQRTRPTPRLGLVVDGYRPRLAGQRGHSLRRWLYVNVQRRLHEAVSERFLAHVTEGAR